MKKKFQIMAVSAGLFIVTAIVIMILSFVKVIGFPGNYICAAILLIETIALAIFGWRYYIAIKPKKDKKK